MSLTPKTVLVVDDSESIRESIGHHLKREFRVLRAPTGEAALATLGRDEVDLVLMNAQLSGI